MTRDAVERRPITRLVTEVTENSSVFALEWPWMPRLFMGWAGCPERHERTPLGNGMANRAGTGQDLAGLVGMVIVVATEAPRPVTMTNVVRIGRPVDLHGWKDISVIDYRYGSYRLIDLGLLLLQDIRVFLAVVSFNRLADGFANVLPVIVLLYQCV